MSNTVTMASEHDAADLKVFLERANHLGCENVRLIGAGSALAVYAAVLTPAGLLDLAPTVMGLRIFERAETDTAPVDIVVQTRAMLDRLAHDALVIPLPLGQAGVPWAGISPPRADWAPRGTMLEIELGLIARAGIDEVAAANGLGTNIVTTVRQEVWGRALTVQNQPEGAPAHLAVPAGAAFAGFGLGFFDTGIAQVTTSGAWTRITTARGHVLVK
jgi:hypothetical protein